MNTQIRYDAVAAETLSRDEVADLLLRYPQVSDAEAKLILAFLRKGRHLDVGILTGDERLKPHLDRFTADHATHFRISFVEGAAVILGIAAFLFICWLAWEAMKPAVSHL